jgi:uncharacterized protein
MRELTRKDLQLPDEEALRILRNGESGVLATVDAEGRPYCVPVDYITIDRFVYFHGAKTGYKLDNIAHNNQVCFTVTGISELVPSGFTRKYESVVLFGNAYVVDEDEAALVLEVMVKKCCPDHIEAGGKIIEKYKSRCTVVKIEATHITGKRNV